MKRTEDEGRKRTKDGGREVEGKMLKVEYRLGYPVVVGDIGVAGEGIGATFIVVLPSARGAPGSGGEKKNHG